MATLFGRVCDDGAQNCEYPLSRINYEANANNVLQFAKRYIWTGSLFMVFFSGSYFVVLYYLPIYFQSVHNASPIGSGVRMLALIIPLTFAAIAQGFAFTKIGIVPVFWIFGAALGAVGSGLFYTMDEYTGTGKWIGFQIIVGFAVGLTTQVALQNAQVQIRSEDLSQATAIINCKFLPSGGVRDSLNELTVSSNHLPSHTIHEARQLTRFFPQSSSLLAAPSSSPQPKAASTINSSSTSSRTSPASTLAWPWQQAPQKFVTRSRQSKSPSSSMLISPACKQSSSSPPPLSAPRRWLVAWETGTNSVRRISRGCRMVVRLEGDYIVIMKEHMAL